jgi:hypothetical protein
MTIGHVQSADTSIDVSVDVSSGQCAVCDHDLDAHDVIGRRYCEATQAQALARVCICRPA